MVVDDTAMFAEPLLMRGSGETCAVNGSTVFVLLKCKIWCHYQRGSDILHHFLAEMKRIDQCPSLEIPPDSDDEGTKFEKIPSVSLHLD